MKVINSNAGIGIPSRIHLNISEIYIERIAPTVRITRILSIVLPNMLLP
jgi:hypothetical protein